MKWGLPVPGDLSRTLSVPEMAMTTTLNHAIWFRRIEGFDATDGLYMESQTSWISGGKALCRSNIFDKAGELIVTTEQEVSKRS
jgi:acyl-CoA thioesterase